MHRHRTAAAPCLLLLPLICWLGAAEPLAGQPMVFGPFGPEGAFHAYQAVLTQLEWNAARLDAANRVFLGATGHLATITSSNENSFVAPVGGAGDLWIGLTDHEAFGGFEEAGPPCCGGNGTAQTGAGFVWLTGEPKPYQNWNADEPNNWLGVEDATHIRGDGRWADHSAGVALGQPGPAFKYVVEYPVNWPAASPLPAWRIEVHKANPGVSLTNLAAADALIAGTNRARVTVSHYAHANMTDSGGRGDFGNDPGVVGVRDENDFAVRGTGFLIVRPGQEGSYVFRANADDGQRLRLDRNRDGDFSDAGETLILDDVLSGPHNVNSPVVTLVPGAYAIEWTWFERDGGAEGEVSASRNGGPFLVLGNDEGGGLEVSQAAGLADEIAGWTQPPGYRVFPTTPDRRGGARPSNFDWETLAANPVSQLTTQDQAYVWAPPDDREFAIGAGTQQAQTFTVGTNGFLTRVEVNVSRLSATNQGDLLWDVRATSAGVPAAADAPLLATGVVAAASVGAFGFVPLEVDWLSVTQGQVRAVVLRVAAGSPNAVYRWRGSGTNPYSRGALYSRSTPGAAWTAPGGGVLEGSFRTFVVPTASLPQPDVVVADDFVARGDQPITSARWWGAPLAGFTNGFEDGFVLSFFRDPLPNVFLGQFRSLRPDTLLATYVAPRAAVRARATGFANADGLALFEYEVDLADTRLVHAEPGVATPTAFAPLSGISTINPVHWLSIAAEVGRRLVPETNSAGVVTNWLEQSTGKRATNNFWGWQTSPVSPTNAPGGTNVTPNVSAPARNQLFVEGTNWVYPPGRWVSNAVLNAELDQAFELLSPCLSLECPPGLTLWTCSNSAPLTLELSLRALCDTNVTVTCTPAPGTVLPVGVHEVVCVAVDGLGRSNVCRSSVTVRRDTAAPVLSCPPGLTLNAPASGMAVALPVTATDDGDWNVVITCTPPSGSFFLVGDTPVNCVATDACGHRATCSFVVSLTGPDEAAGRAAKWIQPPGCLWFTDGAPHGGNRPSGFDWMNVMVRERVPDATFVENPPNTIFNELQRINAATEAAQTFEPFHSGRLGRVDLLLYREAGTVADLVVEIRPTVWMPVPGAYFPDPSAVLASVVVPRAAVPVGTVPANAAWVSVELSSFRIPVTAFADNLAVVLRTPGALPGDAGYLWRAEARSGAAGYGQGAAFTRFQGEGAFRLTSWAGVLGDMAFRTFVDLPLTNLLQPHAIVADDFLSDGRPITAVRWWGSSFPPGYAANVPDGFVLSFFSDVPAGPTNAFSRPGALLGTYLAPMGSVRVNTTGCVGADGHDVYQFEVELRDTCLRNALANVATPGAFLETSNTVYWLAVHAQIGATFTLQRDPAGVVTNCAVALNGRRATNHFWGWHTSPVNWNDASVAGRLEVDVTDWLSRDWATNELPHFERDQAFELLTTNPPACPPRFLRAARDGTHVVLSWAGVGYALQAAWALEADPARTAWRTLGYASPVTVPLDGAHRFFRLVCPPPTPDFGLGLGTAALLVRPGSNATVTVSVMSSNTFQRAVILACAGDAPGIACEFLPNPLTPPADGTANSTLTLSAASNAPPGTYVLQLTGTSGNLIRAVPLQVTVPLLRLPGAPEEPARDRIPDLPLPEPLSEDIVAPQGIPISVRDVIVVLRETATVGEVNALLSLLSADIVGTAPQCRLLLLGLVGPSDLQRVQVAELAARTQNSVAGASINYALEPDLLPPHNVDPDNNRWTWEVPLNGASGDWGLKHIRQPQAWNLVDHAVRRGATIDALVVEANENLLGANVASATHVDLAPRVDVFPGALPSEHATMVAGIIGAVWDNNRGVEGVYPRRLTIVSRGRFFWGTLADTVTRVLGAWADVRVVNYSAGLSRSYFVAGIDPVTALVNPAVPAGAANPTWRGQLDNDGNTFLAAMNAFVAGPLGRTNWLMGCSAGNIRRRPTTALDYEARDNSPVANVAVRGVAGADAGADHFLTVEAMDAAGNRAAFSASAGTLSAPGVCVRSTELDNPHNYDSTSCPARDAADPNYATSSGTSFAAPHVAGLAAYVWSLDSGLSYQAVRQAVEGPFNRVTVGAGPAGGAAGSERIDGFAAILHIDSARGNKTIQRALVNVDDGSHYDGNARIDHDDEDDDENWEEPYEAVVPTGIRHPDGRRGDSDGLINMKDFRPFRDAFVQTALLGLGGVLDGGPIHFKKDLNFDGCVNLLLYRDPAQPAHPPGTIPVPASCVNAPDENVYPRYDFNGSGQIDALGGQTAPPGHAVAPFKIDPDTACTGLNTPAGCLRDLDVMADPDLWDSSSFGEWVSVTGPDGVPPAECEIPGIWAPMRNLLLDRNGDGLVDYLYSADLHFILGPLADSDYDRITVEVYSGPWSKCNVFPLSVKSRTIVTVPLYPGASVLVILTIRDDDPDPRLPSIPYPYFPALSYGQDMTIRWPAP